MGPMDTPLQASGPLIGVQLRAIETTLRDAAEKNKPISPELHNRIEAVAQQVLSLAERGQDNETKYPLTAEHIATKLGGGKG